MPGTDLFFLRTTSTMQFKICHLLVINHLNLILTEQPGKNSETWEAYTYLHSSSECTEFTFYNHSVTFECFSTKFRMLDCFCVLSLKLTRISESFMTAEDNSTLRNSDNRRTHLSLEVHSVLLVQCDTKN